MVHRVVTSALRARPVPGEGGRSPFLRRSPWAHATTPHARRDPTNSERRFTSGANDVAERFADVVNERPTLRNERRMWAVEVKRLERERLGGGSSLCRESALKQGGGCQRG